MNRLFSSISLALILFSISFSLQAADWYRIVAEGTPEQMIEYKKALIEKGSAVTNPRVVEYNGKFVVMTGPYSDDRVNQIRQNYINKNLDPNQLAFFQLTSQPKELIAQKNQAPATAPESRQQTYQQQKPSSPNPAPQRATTGVSLIDMSSMASSVGSCQSILEIAAQRAAADYQVSNNLRALSQKFMDLGNRLNAKNSNDGVLYINSKNDAYQNATNATQADLNAGVSRCVKLSN